MPVRVIENQRDSNCYVPFYNNACLFYWCDEKSLMSDPQCCSYSTAINIICAFTDPERGPEGIAIVFHSVHH